MNDKLLYRIPEVAEHLSISRSKVYELLKSGELRSVHIDRSRLVRARDLHAYVDSLAADDDGGTRPASRAAAGQGVLGHHSKVRPRHEDRNHPDHQKRAVRRPRYPATLTRRSPAQGSAYGQRP